MTYGHDPHTLHVVVRRRDPVTGARLVPAPEIVVTCTCGAHWTHEPTATWDTFAGTYESHVAYSRRAAMTTL